MLSSVIAKSVCVATYPNGQPYTVARGRYAPSAQIEDRLCGGAPIVQGQPSAEEFLEKIVRELRIRFYQSKTVRNYRTALRQLFRWYGGPPHRINREDIREFLLYLVDAGASSSWVSVNLSAIRTAFDKMCGRRVTLGLATPRRPKRLSVVLSKKEIASLLQAAPSLRDKLLLGLMYATGMRVSEVVRLRYRDLDFDRRLINVWQGKGRSDRQVMLPKTFTPLLQPMAKHREGREYLFTGQKSGRHLSPRTAQRVMERAVRIAQIKKKASPHSLRHSFACHTYENGCDIRHIQKLLGHVNLETTTIYVQVARPTDENHVASPLDVMQRRTDAKQTIHQKPVGKLQIYLQQQPSEANPIRTARVTLSIESDGRPIYFKGTLAKEVRPGWVTLEVPPLEAWAEPLRWLSPEQRERIESPEFFQMLQREIPNRLHQLPPPVTV